jgi:hypothetical protein
MPLQLDHVNGVRTDNRLFNLRILCPNCHAQTDTWCSKNGTRPERPAPVPQVVDGTGSNPVVFGHEGSNPSGGTCVVGAGQLQLDESISADGEACLDSLRLGGRPLVT